MTGHEQAQEQPRDEGQTGGQNEVGTRARSVDTPRTMASVAALCDRLEQLRAEATPGDWQHISGRRVASLRFLVADVVTAADADVFEAEHNAIPELIAELRRQAAALHAVEALAVELDAEAPQLIAAGSLDGGAEKFNAAHRIRFALATTAGQ